MPGQSALPWCQDPELGLRSKAEEAGCSLYPLYVSVKAQEESQLVIFVLVALKGGH